VFDLWPRKPAILSLPFRRNTGRVLAWLGLAMFAGAANVRAQQWNTELLGRIYTGGDARGVFVSGARAYVADALGGLQIINVTTPSLPTLLGSYHTSGTASGVYLAGTLAFVACGTSTGLQMINVSNPAQPRLYSFYDTPGEARNVRLASGLAYVADMKSGLAILDVSTPSQPVRRGTYPTSPGSARDVQVVGGSAYLATMRSGLQILNVTNPAAPTLRGTYAYSTAYPESVFLSGTLAYLADSYWGLKIVSVSNPAAPVSRGSYVTPEGAHGVYVSSNLAYVTWGAPLYPESGGLVILDVSNPSNPTLRGSYDAGVSPAGITVAGGLVYVAAGSDGLWILRYAGPGTIPAPPSSLVAMPVSSTQINLTWSDNSSYETGYRIERKVGAGGLWSQIASLPANTTSFQHTGLLPDHLYYYQVRAFNSAGSSSYSNTAYAKTFPTPPAAPTGLSATATSQTAVTLWWRDNSNNEDGFEVENKVGTTGAWLKVAILGPNIRTFRHTGLKDNVFLGYRVRAYNSGGYSAYSNESWARTPRKDTSTRSAWTLYR